MKCSGMLCWKETQSDEKQYLSALCPWLCGKKDSINSSDSVSLSVCVCVYTCTYNSNALIFSLHTNTYTEYTISISNSRGVPPLSIRWHCWSTDLLSDLLENVKKRFLHFKQFLFLSVSSLFLTCPLFRVLIYHHLVCGLEEQIHSLTRASSFFKATRRDEKRGKIITRDWLTTAGQDTKTAS